MKGYLTMSNAYESITFLLHASTHHRRLVFSSFFLSHPPTLLLIRPCIHIVFSCLGHWALPPSHPSDLTCEVLRKTFSWHPHPPLPLVRKPSSCSPVPLSERLNILDVHIVFNVGQACEGCMHMQGIYVSRVWGICVSMYMDVCCMHVQSTCTGEYVCAHAVVYMASGWCRDPGVWK